MTKAELLVILAPFADDIHLVTVDLLDVTVEYGTLPGGEGVLFVSDTDCDEDL